MYNDNWRRLDHPTASGQHEHACTHTRMHTNTRTSARMHAYSVATQMRSLIWTRCRHMT